jgi:hypothetical protein
MVPTYVATLSKNENVTRMECNGHLNVGVFVGKNERAWVPDSY